jgi:amino acid permease
MKDDSENQPLIGGKYAADEDGLQPVQDDSDSGSGYIFLCIPESWATSKHIAMNNSPISTVILLLNSMIGSGILVQAYVFKEAGIIYTIVEYIIVGAMTYVGVDLLVRCADQTQIFEYSELAVAAFGEYGEMVIDISVVVGNLGALLSYIVIIGSLSVNILESYSIADGIFAQGSFWSVLLVCFFVLPPCCIRNFGHLAFISYISISAISGTILLVLIGGPMQASQHKDEALNYASMKGSVSTIGSVVFAFGYASAVFHSYKAIRKPDRNVDTFSSIAVWTTSLGVAMCFVLGIVGYLCFRDDVDADILENFAGGAGTFFKIAVILHLILYIPGDYVIMRYSLFKLFGADVVTAENGTYFIATAASLGLATILACLIQLYASTSQSLSIILDVTGGFAGSCVSFILPALMSIKLLSYERDTFMRALVLAIFGCMIPVLVCASVVLRITSAAT